MSYRSYSRFSKHLTEVLKEIIRRRALRPAVLGGGSSFGILAWHGSTPVIETYCLRNMQGVAPAVLLGTPATFPIPPEKLILLAKKIFLEEEGGIRNPDALANNFRFEFPIISLSKKVCSCVCCCR
jgi:hypothetical protein